MVALNETGSRKARDDHLCKRVDSDRLDLIAPSAVSAGLIVKYPPLTAVATIQRGLVKRPHKFAGLPAPLVDTRRQRFPDETPYAYQPFVEQRLEYQWNEEAKASLHDYNTRDLSI